QGLKWLDQQLCSRCGALDLPDSRYKAINEKGWKHHRVAWKDDGAVLICYDALAIVVGKEKVVKIWEEADRCGSLRFRQWSTWQIEEFAPLFVAKGGQFCSKSIDCWLKSA